MRIRLMPWQAGRAAGGNRPREADRGPFVTVPVLADAVRARTFAGDHAGSGARAEPSLSRPNLSE